jgi:predicted nucleic acid-binding protein
VTLIVDASVAIKWVLSEPESDRADALFDQDDLAAPRLWLTETANVLWKYWQRGHLTSDEVFDRLRALRTMPIEKIDDEGLLDTATGLALSLKHSVYDCVYLAAATTRNTVFVTADKSFVGVVENSPFAPFIRPL